MSDQGKDRRKHKRYNTDVDIYFDFIYDLETKVEFAVMDNEGDKALSPKHSAVSRNVSVGGLCFASCTKVHQGDLLHLEVYLPTAKDPIHMQGQVEWCKPVLATYEDRLLAEIEGQRVYEVGVRMVSVNGQLVDDSIHHDAAYDVDWSIVLDSIFGSYRMLMEGRYKSPDGST